MSGSRSIFNKSLELFSSNHLYEAMDSFSKFVKSGGNQNDVVSAYYYLLTIAEKIKSEKKAKEIRDDFFEYLYSQKLFKELNRELKERELCDLTNHQLRMAVEAAITIGELEDVEKCSAIMIKRFIALKNFKSGIELINEIQNHMRLSNSLVFSLATFYLLQGRGENIEELFERYMTLRIIRVSDITLWIKSLPIDLLFDSRFKTTKIYYKAVLESNQIKSPKKLMNTCYQGFIFYSDNPKILNTLMDYAVENKRKLLYESLSLLSSLINRMNIKDKFSLQRFKKLVDEKFVFEEDEDVEMFEEDYVDMATDLFSQDVYKKVNYGKDRKIEHEVAFLRSVGNYQEANRLSDEELKENQKQSYETIESKNIESIIESIEEKFNRFSKRISLELPELSKDDDGDYDYQMRESINSGTVKITHENFYDVVISLIEMGLYASAQAALRKVKVSKLENRIAKRYLEIEVSRRLGNFGESVALVKEAINTWALNPEELKCFNYLAGEIYRDNSDMRNAKSYYKKVYSEDRNYRMVEERLNEMD